VGATFLRHADEQTIVAVAALKQATAQLGETDFRSWGVLGCNQRPGRAIAAWNFARYGTEGAWGVSPHIVPHRCLHSLSGALTLLLKCEGPNFGVGEPEGVLPLALSWLAQNRAPGLWIALTDLDPELPPNPEVPTAAPGTLIHALVLALQPVSTPPAPKTPAPSAAPLRLRLRSLPTDAVAPRWDVSRVEAWLGGHVPGDWILPGGMLVERTGNLPRSAAGSRLLTGRLQEIRS
jgi:hypothetical protein